MKGVCATWKNVSKTYMYDEEKIAREREGIQVKRVQY